MKSRINFFPFPDTDVYISAGPYHADPERSLSRFLDELSTHKIGHIFAIGRTYGYYYQNHVDGLTYDNRLMIADFNNYFVSNKDGQVILPNELSKQYKIKSKLIKKVGRITTYEIAVNNTTTHNNSTIQVHHYSLADVQPLKLTNDELKYVIEIGSETSDSQKILTHCAGGKGRSAQIAYILASQYEKYKHLPQKKRLEKMREERTGNKDSKHFIQTTQQVAGVQAALINIEDRPYTKAETNALYAYQVVASLFQAEIERLDQEVGLTKTFDSTLGTDNAYSIRDIKEFNGKQKQLIQLLTIYHTLSTKEDIFKTLEQAQALDFVSASFKEAFRSTADRIDLFSQNSIPDAKFASMQREAIEEIKFTTKHLVEKKMERDINALPEKPKVWVFDIDETLLNTGNNEINKEAELFELFRYAAKNNITITLCTNRTDEKDKEIGLAGGVTIEDLIQKIESKTGVRIDRNLIIRYTSIEGRIVSIGQQNSKNQRNNLQFEIRNEETKAFESINNNIIERVAAGKNYQLDTMLLHYNETRLSEAEKSNSTPAGKHIKAKESDFIFIDDGKHIIKAADELTNYRTVEVPVSDDSSEFLIKLAYESAAYNNLIKFLNSDQSPTAINIITNTIPNFSRHGFKYTPIVRHVPLSKFYDRVKHLTRHESKTTEYKYDFTIQALRLYPTLTPSIQDNVKINALKFIEEKIADIEQQLLKIKLSNNTTEVNLLLNKIDQITQLKSLYEANISKCNQVNSDLIKLKHIAETDPAMTELADDELTSFLYTSRLILSLLDEEKLKTHRKELENSRTVDELIGVIRKTNITSDITQKPITGGADLFLHDVLNRMKVDVHQNEYPVNSHKLAFESISKYMDFNELLSFIDQSKEKLASDLDIIDYFNKQEIIKIYIAQAYIRQYDHVGTEKKNIVNAFVMGHLNGQLNKIKQKLYDENDELKKIDAKEIEEASGLFQAIKETISLCESNPNLQNKFIKEDIAKISHGLEKRTTDLALDSKLSDIMPTGVTAFFLEVRQIMQNKELLDQAISERASITLKAKNEAITLHKAEHLFDHQGKLIKDKAKEYIIDTDRTSVATLNDGTVNGTSLNVANDASDRELLVIDAVMHVAEFNLIGKNIEALSKKRDAGQITTAEFDTTAQSIKEEVKKSYCMATVKNVRLDSPLGYNFDSKTIKQSETYVLQSQISHLSDEYKKKGRSKHQKEINSIQKITDGIITNNNLSFDEKTKQIAELLEKELIKQKNSFESYAKIPLLGFFFTKEFSARVQQKKNEYQYPRLLAETLRNLYALNPSLEKNATDNVINTIRNMLAPAAQPAIPVATAQRGSAHRRQNHYSIENMKYGDLVVWAQKLAPQIIQDKNIDRDMKKDFINFFNLIMAAQKTNALLSDNTELESFTKAIKKTLSDFIKKGYDETLDAQLKQSGTPPISYIKNKLEQLGKNAVLYFPEIPQEERGNILENLIGEAPAATSSNSSSNHQRP